jgi:hypothetical protein
LWKKGIKIREIAETMSRTQPSVVTRIAELQSKGKLSYRNKRAGRKLRRKMKVAPIPNLPGYNKPTYTKPKIGDSITTTKEWKAMMNVVFNTTQTKIANECDIIKAFLIQKNLAYGDSALAPIRIFSTSDASEQLKVRIDDKLNRLMQGDNSIETDEEVVKDLIGYLILLLIQMKEA